jgi:hypothetical protein
LPIADATPFQVGDVLELDDGTNLEHVEVIAAPTLTATPNTIPIRRARGGTTAAAFAAAVTIRLIGNSRLGTEIDQQGYRPVSTGIEQIVQTFQYPVQVGGLAEAISNVALPPGANSVMGRDRAIKLVDAGREIERSMYYARGEKPVASGDRAKMKGYRALIASVGNLRSAIGASYTRTAFITDTVAKIDNVGGSADTILCSNDFLVGLDTWVPGKTAQMGGNVTELGFPIETYVLPLGAKPLRFVRAPQLRAGSAIVSSSNDLKVRTIRELFWKPREARGDAIEGDWIGDYCVHLTRPEWHAMVEGITSFAAG